MPVKNCHKAWCRLAQDPDESRTLQDDLLAVLKVRHSLVLEVVDVEPFIQSSVPASAGEPLVVDLKESEPLCKLFVSLR